MILAHMPSLVYIGSSTTIEGPIVLIEVILRRGLSAMEPGQIGAEVGILTHASADTEASWGCLRTTCRLAILDRSCLLHHRL